MKADEMTESKEDYEANAYKIMDMLGPDEDGRPAEERVSTAPNTASNTTNPM